MMIGRPMAALAFISCAVSASFAHATILVDVSPGGDASGAYYNEAPATNLLMRFTLASPASIEGFNLYTEPDLPVIGQGVVVKIRNDHGGEPARKNLTEIDTALASIIPETANTELVGATFSPVLLGAGTYWMGMSGATTQLGWSAFGPKVQIPGQYQLYAEMVKYSPHVGQFGYQILGQVASVGPPSVAEPATWTLMFLGFGVLGCALRSRGERMQVINARRLRRL